MSESVIWRELGTDLEVTGNAPTSLGQRTVAFFIFVLLRSYLAFSPQLSVPFSAGKNTHTFLLREFASGTIRILLKSGFSLGMSRAWVRDLSSGRWPRIKGSES